MCGIVGSIGPPDDSAGARLDAMLAQVLHRGPDDCGTWWGRSARGEQIGLGNTRLAILDLSHAGHQPISTPDGALTIAYNGEVYNFAELRGELESFGHRFRSATDTEVLLFAYRQWGVGMLERLRGMFAFALWDRQQDHLFLARDRLGIKPLYYHHEGGRLIFASEVRALLASGLVSKRLSLVGLNSYLSLGAVQDPVTLVEGIRALPAGHFAIFKGNDLAIRRYWLPWEHEPSCSTFSQAAESLRALLEESVQLHQVSDVPVGVFLSGGLDSSALVGLMARSSRGGAPIHTVTVSFPGSNLSEAAAARSVAEHFHTEHSDIAVTAQSLLAALPAALKAMDQPSFDGINTFVVARHTRELGLKVALSGLGADELFGGYPSFQRYPWLRLAVRLGPAWAQRMLSPLCEFLPVRHDTQTKLRSLMEGGYGNDPFSMLRSLFSSRDRQALARAAWAARPDPNRAPAADAARFNGAQRVVWWELNRYMQNVLLRDSDSLSMAHGLEMRVPFLDHRIMEFALGVPSQVLMPHGDRTLKPLLSRAVADLVPGATLQRRKMGFTFPLEQWVRTDMAAEVETMLLRTPCAPLDDILDCSMVESVWRRYLAGRSSWHRPWALFVLKHWVVQHLA